MLITPTFTFIIVIQILSLYQRLEFNVSLENINQCTLFRRYDHGSFDLELELRGEVSCFATHLNVFNTHRLGLVKIYEKIIKEEPEIRS